MKKFEIIKKKQLVHPKSQRVTEGKKIEINTIATVPIGVNSQHLILNPIRDVKAFEENLRGINMENTLMIQSLTSLTTTPENDKDSNLIQDPNTSTSDEDSQNHKGVWTTSEHKRFLSGYAALGPKWTQISITFVKTRSGQQVACHAGKHFKRESRKQHKMFKYHIYVARKNKMAKVSMVNDNLEK
jgi:hypothetical protein